MPHIYVSHLWSLLKWLHLFSILFLCHIRVRDIAVETLEKYVIYSNIFTV